MPRNRDGNVTDAQRILGEGLVRPRKGPGATSTSRSGDVGLPAAPAFGVIRGLGNSSRSFVFLIGADRPTPATNWNEVDTVQIQVARNDDTFASPVYDQTFTVRPPHQVTFSVSISDTYHFRGRVKNNFGFSAWSTTVAKQADLTADFSDDTGIIGEALNLAITTAGVDNNLAGNEFEISFEIPKANAGSYWGYSIFVHDNASFPDATKFDTGSNGAITAGKSILTDTTKTFTVDALIGKDIVVFSDKRPATEDWDYHGMWYISKIADNDATTVTFDFPEEMQRRTATGLNYYIVNRLAGHHYYEKVRLTTPAIVDESVFGFTDTRTVKKIRFTSGQPTVNAWVTLYNLWGQGELTGPVSATFGGITTEEFKLLSVTSAIIADDAVTTVKIPDSNITTAKLVNDAVTAVKIATDAVEAAKIKALAVTAPKIAANAVTETKILNASISTPKLKANAVTAAKIFANTITAAELAANTITGAEIASLAIATGELAANAVTSAKINAGAVTASKISVTDLAAINANLGTITAGTVTGATLQTATTGARVVQDSTNGFQVFDPGNARQIHFPISGVSTGIAFFGTVRGNSGSLALQNNALNSGVTLNTSAIDFFTNSIGRLKITNTLVQALGGAVFTGAGSGLTGLTASQIPSLGAGKITSGTFAAARIPNLAGSKITSGTVADARLSANVGLLNGTNTWSAVNDFGSGLKLEDLGASTGAPTNLPARRLAFVTKTGTGRRLVLSDETGTNRYFPEVAW